MEHESLALTTMYTAGICGLLGIVIPWLALLVNRAAAAISAGTLAFAATVAFLISNIYMPGHFNIRVDLLVLPPLLLMVWLQCVALSVLAMWQRGRAASTAAESLSEE
jgi:hypothetical protein